MAPVMLRAADVAKRLSCHVTTVHRLARSGQLPAAASRASGTRSRPRLLAPASSRSRRTACVALAGTG